MARRLTRNTRQGILGGVAAGFADYLNVDPVLVRLGFILFLFVNGLSVPVYLVCWVIIPRGAPEPDAAAGETPPAPEQPPGERIVEDVRAAGEKAVNEVRRSVGQPGSGGLLVGAILIVLGLLFLLDRFAWFHWWHRLHFANLWPLILVAAGIALIVGARRSKSS